MALSQGLDSIWPLQPSHILRALAYVAIVALGYGLYCGYRTRRIFRVLQDQGIPIIKHSMLLGHLEAVGNIMSSIPGDAHGDYLLVKLRENWRELFPNCNSCPPVAYLDLWPFAPPTLVSLNPSISAQFTQEHSLPKAYQQKRVLYPLTHNRDLASMEGVEWKIWRRRLNPGFSIQNITSRIPDIIEEVEVFARNLESRAGKDGEWGDVFPLEVGAIGLALDVMMRFVFNKRFHEQTRRSPISRALVDTISRMYFHVNIANFFSFISPWRQFKIRSNFRIIKQHLVPHFQERIAEIQRDHEVTNKTLVDLIFESISEEKGQRDTLPPSLVFGEDFLEMAVGQTTTFLFAGHDTTAFTLCYLIYTLSSHPHIMQKLRAEHDAVLGPDPARAPSILRENPHLLNSLSYTHAVLKETMRVHSNVGSMRRGEPGFFLTGPADSGPGFAGKKLPTDGFVVWDGTFAIHLDPAVWHRADEFLPERFLVTDESHPLYPPKSAWRGFSGGPRACIGQHLALVEVKLAIALIARRLDIACVWNEPTVGKKSKSSPPPNVAGERCYQVGADTPPRIKDGMPVHVRVR